jgi:hypothetical protein
MVRGYLELAERRVNRLDADPEAELRAALAPHLRGIADDALGLVRVVGVRDDVRGLRRLTGRQSVPLPIFCPTESW